MTLRADGTIDPATDRVLATFDPEEPGGPDGLKVDVDGRLYVAVAGGVWVLEPDGRLLGILSTPKRPSNLAWGGPDGRSLAITAVDTVHVARLRVPGVLPPFR
jgi:gluconolactonase